MSRDLLLECLAAGLTAVSGRQRVRETLAADTAPAPVHVLAVGKAAPAMLHGAAEALGSRLAAGLLVAPHGSRIEALPAGVRVLHAGHPVPDAGSLEAGGRAREFVATVPAGARLLVLLSGGASALLEEPAPGVTAAGLQQANRWLLGSGLPIDAVNAVRARLSRLKNGGLLAALPKACTAEVLLISDVPGDDPAVIGSGPFLPRAVPMPPGLPAWLDALCRDAGAASPVTRRIPHRIVARNADCRAAAAARARQAGQTVHDHGTTLAGDAGETGRRLAAALRDAPPGIHLWGGETTVSLPAHPGRGGRNQQLALAAAIELAGRNDLLLLAAGTDGVDGNSEDAGALVDGDTLQRGRSAGADAADCLRRADAGSFLEASGDLVHTGPTGTNVMDAVIAFKKG